MENHSLDSLILIQYRCIESHEPYSYALCYQNLIIDRLKPIANNLDFKLFVQQRYTIECFKLDIFLPSVYDTLFIVRSSSNLRDGTVVRYLHIRQYLSSLPFNDSYLLSFIHLMPANYSLVTANYSFYSTKILRNYHAI